MADSSRALYSSSPQPHPPPPPPPPLPPQQRPSVLQRFIGPLAFHRPSRQQGTPTAQSNSASPKDASQDRPLRRAPARNAVHRTSIPIAAIDVNESRTHAVLAGRDILKTIRVQDRAVVEELNLRNAVTNYISTQQFRADEIHKRREYLPAKDVRWSHGQFANVVATAAQNGRIALYDVLTQGSSRVELAHLYQHVGQVNKLDFDPHQGYMLLSGSQDKYCKIWDIREPSKPSGYNQYQVKAPVRDVRWSPTNVVEMALCTESGMIQKWDVRNPSQYLLSINAHSKSCYTIAWHPDGKHLASGGIDKLLRVWNMNSELKGQKHLLQLRCPHGIMNLAWRPPSWSAEFARKGSWQSCHIATSYNEDDPRVHVWDLRRPLLPFRELNNYETRPTDLLWADKDLLWTVGGSGIFVQSDMSYASQVEESLPPGAVEWCSDGSFYAVVENRTIRRRPSLSFTDPSAVFLNIPQDRLSGVEDGTASRSLTDDEGIDTSLQENIRRQSKPTTTRTKSHPNTPPAHDNQLKVLTLDQAIMGKKDMFVNGQIGAVSRIPGIFLPLGVVDFVAQNYEKAMTARERATEPDKILDHLKHAFMHNAKVCQFAELPEIASQWRLMAEIVVPELKLWADHNRKMRLSKEEQNRTKDNDRQEDINQHIIPSASKVNMAGKETKSPARSEMVANHLFRGVVESHKGSSDAGSHGGSNMTTPRQQPMQSPPSSSRKGVSTWFTLDDSIEPITPLPPSLSNSHSTAAAASRALLDNSSDPTDSPMSSPERPRLSAGSLKGHRRSATESAPYTMKLTEAKENDQGTIIVTGAARAPTPLLNRNQEDRRAALRDYKASTRQPFSLEAPIVGSNYGREDRHDSSESFPMFSASGGSSARTRSFGRSFDVPNMPESLSRSRQDSSEWFERDGYYISIARDNDDTPSTEDKEGSASQIRNFEPEESPSLPFGLDGITDSKPVAPSDRITEKFKEVLARSPQSKGEVKEPVAQAKSDISTSMTRPVSDIEPTPGASNRGYLFTNPFLRNGNNTGKLRKIAEDDESLKSSYQISDFQPIDITKYEPWTPNFAISAYPVICEAIQFDISQGPACAQFSAHLLSHIHPFFFHQSLRLKASAADHAMHCNSSLATRLMNPVFSSRHILGIFGTHIEHLRNLQLYIPAAELRKLCVEEFDYPLLAGPEARSQAGAAIGDQLKVDPLKMKASCSKCKVLLSTDAKVCTNCYHRVEKCPICELSLTTDPVNSSVPSDVLISQPIKLATNVYCHICGHATHLCCMETWLEFDDVKGECPTPGCGCDCGPGLLRDQRIVRQIEANQELPTNRPSVSSIVKRDSKVVGQIPAVDKARNTLRKRPSEGFGAGTSADGGGSLEDKLTTPSSTGTAGSTSVWSKKGTSAGTARMSAPALGRSNSGGVGSTSGGTNGGASFGRRVRLVEPEK